MNQTPDNEKKEEQQIMNKSYGRIALERILNRAGLVAVHLEKDGENFRTTYISENISSYGYTREQFYEDQLHFVDIVCPEDRDVVEDSVVEAAKSGEKELSFSCRIFTDIKELIPVRVDIWYIYDDNDELKYIETLITDSREELKRNSENMHLNRAISKIKSVVLVKSYHAGKRTLRYISPNAGILGMNVEALTKGYRLTEDYIHPEDRDAVIDTIYQAVANGITDYVHTYRMVRDDGEQIWVMNEVTVTRMSDGEAEISFLLTDITEQKEIEAELSLVREEAAKKPDGTPKEDKKSAAVEGNNGEMVEQLQLMASALGQNADYYTALLDDKGNLMTEPVGPAGDMGQFYDLFERPQFKETFGIASGKAKELLVPQSVNFALDSLKVNMVIAPLTMKDVVTAYWVLTSFSADGMERLQAVIEKEWKLANSIAKSYFAEDLALREQKLRKRIEVQLDTEMKSRDVLREVLNNLVTKREAGLGDSCQKVCVNLQIANLGIYVANKNGKKIESYYTWNRFGEETSFFDEMTLSGAEYKVLREYMKDKIYVVVNKASADPFLMEILNRTRMEVIFIQSVIVGSGEQGYIVFADNKENRKFDEKDISFMTVASRIFEALLRSNQKTIRAQGVKEAFLETYDYIRDAVFVKDNRTGDIIFTNKAMDKLFGYSLVGTMAKDVVNDELEHYKDMGGVRKRFITNKKVTKWQRYMKELDQIMNIVEIHLELYNDTDYSLYILKKNKLKNNAPLS